MLKLRILKAVSFSGLALILVQSFMVFYGKTTLDAFHDYALIGTLLWLATAPFWINKD
jgi:hypothetical protein